jgi:hypothetical protein
MNELTPLHDDGLDEGLRSALLRIDRGPELTIDIDEVLLRGARHRRRVTLERFGAVAAVVLVVVAAGSFALTRTPPQSTPVDPASSASPTATPTPTGTPVEAPVMVAGSSGTSGIPKLQRGITGIEIVNTGTEATTVSIQEVIASGATLKAVLKEVAPSKEHALIFDDALVNSVDRPAPASVTVPAGEYVLLVMAVDVTRCPATLAGVNELADGVSTNVTLSLRTASGGTGTLDVTQSDGTDTGWVRTGLWYACGFPPKA